MSIGKRERGRQDAIWIEASCLATPGGHPFYEKLNGLLNQRKFDGFAEDTCRSFYSKRGGPDWRLRCIFGCYWSDTSRHRFGMPDRLNDARTLLYQFEVGDLSAFAKSWRGESDDCRGRADL